MTGVLDVKKEYLTDSEIREYDASVKQISILQSEIVKLNTIIEQLRNGVKEMNNEMHKRHLDAMMKR